MIRQMTDHEVNLVARIWHRSGLAEYTYLPSFQALSESEALAIFNQIIAAECEVWVEVHNGVIRGFIALKGSYIDRLYVDPPYLRHGIGSNLLRHAKALQPEGLELHTHVQNRRARAVYERFGFEAVKFDISPAPESVPDVEYHWRPS